MRVRVSPFAPTVIKAPPYNDQALVVVRGCFWFFPPLFRLLVLVFCFSFSHQYLYNSDHAAAGATFSWVRPLLLSLSPLLFSNWQKQQSGNRIHGSFQRLNLVGVGISVVFFRVGVGNFFGHLDIDSGVENNRAFFADCVMFGRLPWVALSRII